MSILETSSGPGVIPTLRYRNVAAAVDWLCAAFALEKSSVVTADDGTIVYAGLAHRRALIMVGQVQDSALDRLMKQPDEIGGAETQSCYLVIDDADAHRERAIANGAEIVIDIRDFEHGGRGYSCRDLEGHIWNFGTYDPCPAKSIPFAQDSAPLAAENGIKWLSPGYIFAAYSIGLVAVLGLAWLTANTLRLDLSDEMQKVVALERAARETAERKASSLTSQLTQERRKYQDSERAAGERIEHAVNEFRAGKEGLRRALDLELSLAREAAQRLEKAAEEAQTALARETEARHNAERAERQSQEHLLQERAALARAELVAKEATERLAQERIARETAERIAQVSSEQRLKQRAPAENPDRPAKSAPNVSASEPLGTDAPMPSFLRRP